MYMYMYVYYIFLYIPIFYHISFLFIPRYPNIYKKKITAKQQKQ